MERGWVRSGYLRFACSSLVGDVVDTNTHDGEVEAILPSQSISIEPRRVSRLASVWDSCLRVGVSGPAGIEMTAAG